MSITPSILPPRSGGNGVIVGKQKLVFFMNQLLICYCYPLIVNLNALYGLIVNPSAFYELIINKVSFMNKFLHFFLRTLLI